MFLFSREKFSIKIFTLTQFTTDNFVTLILGEEMGSDQKWRKVEIDF